MSFPLPRPPDTFTRIHTYGAPSRHLRTVRDSRADCSISPRSVPLQPDMLRHVARRCVAVFANRNVSQLRRAGGASGGKGAVHEEHAMQLAGVSWLAGLSGGAVRRVAARPAGARGVYARRRQGVVRVVRVAPPQLPRRSACAPESNAFASPAALPTPRCCCCGRTLQAVPPCVGATAGRSSGPFAFCRAAMQRRAYERKGRPISSSASSKFSLDFANEAQSAKLCFARAMHTSAANPCPNDISPLIQAPAPTRPHTHAQTRARLQPTDRTS